MTIEVALGISALSLIFAVYSGTTAMKRAAKSDDKSEASELTTVIVKLETISTGVSEIKGELKNVRSDVEGLRERIVVVEESAKQGHKRLDSFESRLNQNDIGVVK